MFLPLAGSPGAREHMRQGTQGPGTKTGTQKGRWAGPRTGLGLAWGAKGPGPDQLGFGLGGQASWAGPAWFWLGRPRVLGRTGLVLAWGAKGPGPDRLGFGLGGQGPWAGPAWFSILRRTMTVIGMLIKY